MHTLCTQLFQMAYCRCMQKDLCIRMNKGFRIVILDPK